MKIKAQKIIWFHVISYHFMWKKKHEKNSCLAPEFLEAMFMFMVDYKRLSVIEYGRQMWDFSAL